MSIWPLYNLLKKHYILRCLVLITFLSITLFLFTSTVDIINYKMYVCIIIISIYVLSLLVKQFEQNPQIEYLNLVLLYLNLLMFILFFFWGLSLCYCWDIQNNNEIMNVILEKKLKIRFLMISLFVLSIFCFKNKKIIVPVEKDITEVNIYWHRCDLVLTRRLQPLHDVGKELFSIWLLLGILNIIILNFKSYGTILIYIHNILQIFIILVFIIMVLHTLWFIFILFIYLRKMRIQVTKYDKDKYFRVLQ